MGDTGRAPFVRGLRAVLRFVDADVVLFGSALEPGEPRDCDLWIGGPEADRADRAARQWAAQVEVDVDVVRDGERSSHVDGAFRFLASCGVVLVGVVPRVEPGLTSDVAASTLREHLAGDAACQAISALVLARRGFSAVEKQLVMTLRTLLRSQATRPDQWRALNRVPDVVLSDELCQAAGTTRQAPDRFVTAARFLVTAT